MYNIISPPGDTIKELCDDHEVSIDQLAERLTITNQEATKLIDGDFPINKHISEKLEQLFDIPAAFWINRQEHYDNTKSNVDHS